MQIEIANVPDTAFGFAFAHPKKVQAKKPARKTPPATPIRTVEETKPTAPHVPKVSPRTPAPAQVEGNGRTAMMRRKRDGRIVRVPVPVQVLRLSEADQRGRHLPAKCVGPSGVDAMVGFRHIVRVWTEENWDPLGDDEYYEKLERHELNWRANTDLAKEYALLAGPAHPFEFLPAGAFGRHIPCATVSDEL